MNSTKKRKGKFREEGHIKEESGANTRSSEKERGPGRPNKGGKFRKITGENWGDARKAKGGGEHQKNLGCDKKRKGKR